MQVLLIYLNLKIKCNNIVLIFIETGQKNKKYSKYFQVKNNIT